MAEQLVQHHTVSPPSAVKVNLPAMVQSGFAQKHPNDELGEAIDVQLAEFALYRPREAPAKENHSFLLLSNEVRRPVKSIPPHTAARRRTPHGFQHAVMQADLMHSDEARADLLCKFEGGLLGKSTRSSP